MTIQSVDEFRTRERPAAPVAVERISQLKGIAQEAVRAEALTGLESWDWFLRYLEANIKAAERMADAKKNQAASLVLVDEGAAKAAAVLAATYQVRAETLKELILLPKQLVQNSADAKKKIAELEQSV